MNKLKDIWHELSMQTYKDGTPMPWAKVMQEVENNNSYTLTIRVDNKKIESFFGTHVSSVDSEGKLCANGDVKTFLHGSSSELRININQTGVMKDDFDSKGDVVAYDLNALLIHETVHAYQDMTAMTSSVNPLFNQIAKEDEAKGITTDPRLEYILNGWESQLKESQAVAIENKYRSFMGLQQRTSYGGLFPVLTYSYNEEFSLFNTNTLDKEKAKGLAFSHMGNVDLEPQFINWNNLYSGEIQQAILQSLHKHP